jgi:hypothetical protein
MRDEQMVANAQHGAAQLFMRMISSGVVLSFRAILASTSPISQRIRSFPEMDSAIAEWQHSFSRVNPSLLRDVFRWDIFE